MAILASAMFLTTSNLTAYAFQLASEFSTEQNFRKFAGRYKHFNAFPAKIITDLAAKQISTR